MLMTLIRSCLQGRKLFSCAQVQDNLQFIDFTSEREAYVCFLCIRSMDHMYPYLRNDGKITFRMGSAQLFINEAPAVSFGRNGRFIYIYIYIRGVTVHKIHGSVRYDTVVSRFGMFSIRGAGQVAMLEIFLF